MASFSFIHYSSNPLYNKNKSMVQLDKSTYNWLHKLNLVPPASNPNQERITISDDTEKHLHSGIKISEIVTEIFKKRGEKPPESLASLKHNPQSAGQLYNWNLLNEVVHWLCRF